MKTYEGLMLGDRAPENRVKAAQLRLLATAAEMNIAVTFSEVEKFGLVLVALEDEAAAGDGTKP